MLVVTPNLCFDRTLWVEVFEAGTVSRPHRVEVTAGGKGVNVTRTVADLGGSATLVGLVAEHGGPELVDLLTAEGLTVHPVAVDGTARSATIVIEKSQRATVLNEPGPTVGEQDLQALLDAVDSSMDETGLVVCSGSLPPGLPDDAYARVTELVHDRGGTCIVDGARAALRSALAAGPDLVCPNLDEAEGMTTGAILESSHHVSDADDVRLRATNAARALRAAGPVRAVVTAGAHGAAFSEDGDQWITAPAVTVANPIGAGDSFVAGVATAVVDGSSWAAAVRRGVIVASAAVEHPRAGRVDRERVDELAAAGPSDVAVAR